MVCSVCIKVIGMVLMVGKSRNCFVVVFYVLSVSIKPCQYVCTEPKFSSFEINFSLVAYTL